MSEAIEVTCDTADVSRFAGLSATLDHRESVWRSGMVPPLGHWLYFPPRALQSSLGDDGHPILQEDGILPKSDLPRRMWAGSRIEFLQDIPLGAKLIRRSRRLSLTAKEGRSGRMIFVTLHHAIEVEGAGLALSEEQDIVYREANRAGTSSAAPAEQPQWQSAAGEVTSVKHPDEVMLFRFSALTFNAHRIHYDRDYAREVEGYPGLVVHGPLIATLLMDHLLHQIPDAPVASFAFRAVSPLFCGNAIHLGSVQQGDEIMLTASGPSGVGMKASVRLKQQ